MSSLSVLLRSGALIVGISFILGCSGEGGTAPSTTKVGGKITYGGGEWPHKATLSFVSVAGAASNTELHSGSADVKPDGTFTAETFAPGDGLVPGKYEVIVNCWDSDQVTNPNAKNLAPKEFQSPGTTPLKVDVPAGSAPITVEWDVPAK